MRSYYFISLKGQIVYKKVYIIIFKNYYVLSYVDLPKISLKHCFLSILDLILKKNVYFKKKNKQQQQQQQQQQKTNTFLIYFLKLSMFSQLFPNPILTAGGKKGKKKSRRY